MATEETDVLDIVWKMAISDEENNILAGIDQFDKIHIFEDPQKILDYVVDVNKDSPMVPIIMSFILGIETGKKLAAKDVLRAWWNDDGWGTPAMLDKYGLTAQEVDRT